MKKYVLSAALLAMLPFLMGSVSKGPSNTILPMEKDFLTSTASAPAFQNETGEYFFRYIFEADIDGNFLAQVNDLVRPDVNIWTHLAGVIPLYGTPAKAQLVVIPGQQAKAQKLFDAIANNRPRPFQPRRVGNAGMVAIGGQRSSRYSGLWRYYIHVGRQTLFTAYDITCNNNNPRVLAPNGQRQRACDLDALLEVRTCLKIKATGIRWNLDQMR